MKLGSTELTMFDVVMIGLLIAAISFFIGVAAAHADPIDNDYPDKLLTPGVARTVALKVLCTAGSTKDARHVTPAMKREVFKRYGLIEGHYTPSDYEIDHFISLENGGANDVLNLWPQKYCKVGNDPLKTGCYGARDKDVVETKLHRWLCEKKITLKEVQSILMDDWKACYITAKSGKICHP